MYRRRVSGLDVYNYGDSQQKLHQPYKVSLYVSSCLHFELGKLYFFLYHTSFSFVCFETGPHRVALAGLKLTSCVDQFVLKLTNIYLPLGH